MFLSKMRRLFALLLCMVLAAAIATGFCGCGKSETMSSSAPAGKVLEGGAIGEGSRHFTFVVVSLEGDSTEFTVSTEEETVGNALMALGLISGEPGPYGLYVKTVNGLTADYDADGTYWGFYCNGDFAMASADLTPIEEGAVYTFKVEK